MSDDPIGDAVGELLPDLRSRFERKPKLHPITCPRCRGEKTIKARRARWNPDGWSKQPRMACPTCGGLGTI